MKTKYLLAILFLTSGLMTSAQYISQQNSPVMIESQSRYGFNETIDTLSNAILAKGWKVTMTHDLQQTMQKNGKEVLPVKVIELCNPGLAFQILSRDDLRHATPLLPCRISVYEKADGNTYVSRMNAPAFAAMIGGDAAQTILQAFTEAEGFVGIVAR